MNTKHKQMLKALITSPPINPPTEKSTEMVEHIVLTEKYAKMTDTKLLQMINNKDKLLVRKDIFKFSASCEDIKWMKQIISQKLNRNTNKTKTYTIEMLCEDIHKQIQDEENQNKVYSTNWFNYNNQFPIPDNNIKTEFHPELTVEQYTRQNQQRHPRAFEKKRNSNTSNKNKDSNKSNKNKNRENENKRKERVKENKSKVRMKSNKRKDKVKEITPQRKYGWIERDRKEKERKRKQRNKKKRKQKKKKKQQKIKEFVESDTEEESEDNTNNEEDDSDI